MKNYKNAKPSRAKLPEDEKILGGATGPLSKNPKRLERIKKLFKDLEED